MIRSTIFWIHLACGVVAGLVVLMMSVTGVLLTYERQIVAWAERSTYPAPAPGAERLTLEELVAAAKLRRPEFTATTVMLRNEPDAPVVLGAGRSGSLLVDPYSGDVREPGPQALRSFFAAVTGWHRWFNATGESRATARAITGGSNLAFLFLVLSGIYLWLPRMWKWALFKTRLFFNPKAGSAKARDFNWHHVFGIWSAIPLAVVVATAAVFSYPWANDLVYRIAGEEPPRQGGGGPPRGAGGLAEAAVAPSGTAIDRLGYDALLARAAAHGDWRTLTLNIPANPDASSVRVGIDEGNGGQPYLRHMLTLDASTGAVESWAPFSSQTTGQKARSWIRFLHTGEALGVVGQTIAGLVSLTSVLMVWTGLALAWRRLVQPLLRRKAVTSTPEAA
ncbi:MAG TPA: PepSY-associated TM helix domain-containing protein [Gammaproteobacteria bacterium]|nr:PepSY-associated TM helix domain-containing protein [Gammaproteobacteria bacterium]